MHLKAEMMARKSAETESRDIRYVIDSAAGSVDGISVGMTEATLRESGKPCDVRTMIVEGGMKYRAYEVHLAADVRLECVLAMARYMASRILQPKFAMSKDLALVAVARAEQGLSGGKFVTGIAARIQPRWSKDAERNLQSDEDEEPCIQERVPDCPVSNSFIQAHCDETIRSDSHVAGIGIHRQRRSEDRNSHLPLASVLSQR